MVKDSDNGVGDPVQESCDQLGDLGSSGPTRKKQALRVRRRSTLQLIGGGVLSLFVNQRGRRNIEQSKEDGEVEPLLAPSDVEDDGIAEDGGEKSDHRHSEQGPKDNYNLAYMIFYLQGVGCLVPWNAFITVDTYWKSRLEGSAFQSNVLPYFTTTFQLVNIGLLVCATNLMNRITLKWRIGLPLFLQFAIFCVILYMCKWDMPPDEFFYITLTCVVLSAATTSFFQGGLFGLSGMLPFKYTQALMGGQGLGGVGIAVMNILTISFVDNPDDAAYIFFWVAVAVLFLCNATFLILVQLPVVQFYSKAAKSRNTELSVSTTAKKSTSVGQIMYQIAPMAFSVAFVFTVTLAVFPAVAANIQSNSTGSYATKLFVPVFCFLGFNLGDWIGRTIAGRPSLRWPPPEKPSLMKYPVLCRVVLIPLFMLCNTDTSSLSPTQVVPNLITPDAIPYILMLITGVSNGYWGTLCMMYGPGMVASEDSERAGSLMLLSLVVGLLMGSVMAFAILAIMCKCNSFYPPGSPSAGSSTTTASAAYTALDAF
eukprot:m.855386 g.855386  ORF g.855386 m.855386 type:complete len:539 (+) comp23509_c0_seq2:190-1806(+)